MADGKGFEGWVEIFRGGRQTAANGKEYDGDELIAKAVAGFDPAFHEPPVVLGHPQGDMPAYGWVEALKSEVAGGAKVLFARFKQVVPEFAEAVEKGRFKKRSAAFYPDGRLRHVGFLGAMVPAVKGLAEIKFEDGAEPIEFYDQRLGTLARIFGRLRDYLIERDGTEKADQVISSWEVDDLKGEAMRDEPIEAVTVAYSEPKETSMSETTTLTQADIDAARAAGKQEAEAEFAERQKIEALAADKERIAAYLKTPLKDGGPLPAWIDGGLGEFLEALAGEEAIEFGEGDKRPRLDWALTFLGGIAAGPEFKEIAGRGTEATVSGDPREVARQAVEFKEAEAAKGRTITITEAVAHVTAAAR